MPLDPPIVCNLWGGPGSGKSTTAALLFGKLKSRGVRAELVTEYAKDLVWEGRTKTLGSQLYVTGKQSWRQERLVGQVDVIVTDSPIPMGLVYTELVTRGFEAIVQEVYNRYDNLDCLLLRDLESHPYQQYGRSQDLEGARGLDWTIAQLLNQIYRDHLHGYFVPTIPAGEELATWLVDQVVERLKERGAPDA
jgi:hypothetical protein